MHTINDKAYLVYELKCDLFNFKTKGLWFFTIGHWGRDYKKLCSYPVFTFYLLYTDCVFNFLANLIN